MGATLRSAGRVSKIIATVTVPSIRDDYIAAAPPCIKRLAYEAVDPEAFARHVITWVRLAFEESADRGAALWAIVGEFCPASLNRQEWRKRVMRLLRETQTGYQCDHPTIKPACMSAACARHPQGVQDRLRFVRLEHHVPMFKGERQYHDGHWRLIIEYKAEQHQLPLVSTDDLHSFAQVRKLLMELHIPPPHYDWRRWEDAIYAMSAESRIIEVSQDFAQLEKLRLAIGSAIRYLRRDAEWFADVLQGKAVHCRKRDAYAVRSEALLKTTQLRHLVKRNSSAWVSLREKIGIETNGVVKIAGRSVKVWWVPSSVLKRD